MGALGNDNQPRASPADNSELGDQFARGHSRANRAPAPNPGAPHRSCRDAARSASLRDPRAGAGLAIAATQSSRFRRIALRCRCAVERAVAPLRQALRAEARACVRFETPPGKQLHIDFGEMRVSIGNEAVGVYPFVGTLSYSRQLFVSPFRHERRSAWFDGLEAASQHFAACPRRCCSTMCGATIKVRTRSHPDCRATTMLARLWITTRRQRARCGS